MAHFLTVPSIHPKTPALAVRQRVVRPWALTATSGLVALLLLLPLVFLLLQAAQIGWAAVAGLLFRTLTAQLLWNTVALTTVATLACAVVGTAAALAVEYTDLPLRQVWGPLIVLPVAIPDFVVGFAWASWLPVLHGFVGAALVMTLTLYPLVYLPVAAALRNVDPAQEETARCLGLGSWETLWRVTLRQARPAVLGGSLIVALALLAEYGAFEILRFQSFTTEIYTEFKTGFSVPTACALSLVLVVLSLALLVAEAAVGRGGRVARPHVTRGSRRKHLGRGAVVALLGLGLLCTLGLGVPVGMIAYWLIVGGSTTLPAGLLATATEQTAAYSASAAGLATLLALPVALLSVRHRSRLSVLLERSTYLVQGLPGLIIALGLVFFTIRSLRPLYQSPESLVLAYAIEFFPLALVAVRTSVAQAPVGLEEIGRSLGRGAGAVMWRITLPLLAPGLIAAFCLVFLSSVTELTATLVLIPTGAHTLASQFWVYQTNLSYGAAAPYAAVIVALAAIPGYLLGRWFDSLAYRRAVTP